MFRAMAFVSRPGSALPPWLTHANTVEDTPERPVLNVPHAGAAQRCCAPAYRGCRLGKSNALLQARPPTLRGETDARPPIGLLLRARRASKPPVSRSLR